MHDAGREIGSRDYMLANCNWQWRPLTLSQCSAKAACASKKIHRGRRVVLETLLIFLALIGSFVLVGLLIRFSENVIRPTDDMASSEVGTIGHEQRAA